VVIVFVWSFTISLILYYIVNFLYPLRVTDEEELIGLDLSQHGEMIGPMVIIHPIQQAAVAKEAVEPTRNAHNFPHSTHVAAAGYPTSPFPNQMPSRVDTETMQSLVDPRLAQEGTTIIVAQHQQ
jgi:hypothetical protein